ncbi:MAG: hypothetical protein ACOZQL_42005 [Myxococcota bacterium]
MTERPAEDAGCVPEVRMVHLDSFTGMFVQGQVYPTGRGDYVFPYVLVADSSFRQFWWPQAEPLGTAPRGPLWFHPDGVRWVLLITGISNTGINTGVHPLYLVEFDDGLRAGRETLIATFADEESFGVVAARHPTGRSIRVCLKPWVGSIVPWRAATRMLFFDDRTMTTRMMPDSVTGCLDAADTADGTEFLVSTTDGGQGICHVASPQAPMEVVPVSARGSCKLVGADGGAPSLWCAEGKRLLRYETALATGATHEFGSESEWMLLGAVDGRDAVIVGESIGGSLRYSIIGTSIRREYEFSEAAPDQWLFGDLSPSRFVMGAGLLDGGKELRLECW